MQNSGGSPNRGTILADTLFSPLTPTLSLREREQSRSGFAIPSPSGRGTEGEGGRATILASV